MALIVLSALMTNITGKLGGSYFSKKKGSPSLNRCGSKLTKADSGRVAMQQAQNRLAYNSRQWQLVSEENRTAWAATASTLTWKNKAGQDYTPSGYELYMSVNSYKTVLGQETIPTPNPSLATGDIDAVGMGFSVAGILQLKYPPASPSEQCVVIMASAPNSLGASYPRGGYKTIYTATSIASGNTDLTNEYGNAFGWQPPYGAIFFKILFIDKSSGICNGSKLTKADSGFAPA